MSVPAFIELVRQNQKPGMVVAEIGCHNGESSQHWLPIVEDNAGWGIVVDFFLGNPTVAAGNGHGQISYQRDETMSILFQRLRVFPRFMLLCGDSCHCAKLVADGSIDICFFDGDHRYQGLARDLNAWLPKVKKGGIVCGHDCDTLNYNEAFTEQDTEGGLHHGVAKAITERFKKLRGIGDTVWVADDAT